MCDKFLNRNITEIKNNEKNLNASYNKINSKLSSSIQ